MADSQGNYGQSKSRSLPPTMNRSQPQIATAYAPGAMFTWEGGKGACIAVPVEQEEIDLSSRFTVREQIRETLHEFCKSWLHRGLSISTTRTSPVYPNQLLDSCFLNPLTADVEFGMAAFAFMRPERMGYLPGPLSYRCDTCLKVKEYRSADHQLGDPLPDHCQRGDALGGPCRWRQLDVVYVHWSGGLEALSPFRYVFNQEGEVTKTSRCTCGSEEFALVKRGNQFSRWRFKCFGCQAEREVYQTDKFTYEQLKPLMEKQVPHEWNEINMIPVSYRASPVFYVQSARFIVYKDAELVSLLRPEKKNALVSKLASLHGMVAGEPTDAEIEAQLAEAGPKATSQWQTYQGLLNLAKGAAGSSDEILKMARQMREAWFRDGLVKKTAQASLPLRARVDEREDYARRYDPIRATIEHDAFKRERLDLPQSSNDLREPHPELCVEHGCPGHEDVYRARVAEDLDRTGVSDLRLVKNLDMVEFSFGYTRVSSTPETTQKNRSMPVRLMAFPPLPSHKRPVYVIEQQNEALYFRLNADAVGAFLMRNGVLSEMPVAPRTLGSVMLETYRDFKLFLQDFRVRDDRAQVRGRDVTSMTYLLLHTMSHHVMHDIARFSGLDLGSMSEVIFPADLAFVVHRRGMTEDLGNISSMWRDHNSGFLRYLVARRELRCGSGTLCDHRGGACPACIMIPETSCVAGNQLLSRAALIGGEPPLWDQVGTKLVGYFEIVRELREMRERQGS
ncbi:hypothetical protein ACFPL7_24130 [Dongia soli]|uniref:Uncharacterized protein n=1 Tax=Dongia soli TaxID=600628 RepID=A0ABU5EJA7_9PROT|nr:hypothetical protein [Dongia soli]MDY0885393.1 hypothetical protein [Dongia soli]